MLLNAKDSFLNNKISATTLRAYTLKLVGLSRLFLSIIPIDKINNTIKNAKNILAIKETNDPTYLWNQLMIKQTAIIKDSKLKALTSANRAKALHKMKVDIVMKLLKLADDQIQFSSTDVRSGGDNATRIPHCADMMSNKRKRCDGEEAADEYDDDSDGSLQSIEDDSDNDDGGSFVHTGIKTQASCISGNIYRISITVEYQNHFLINSIVKIRHPL